MRTGNQTDVLGFVCRTPFAPNGAEGVLAGASVVFFSFVGFDTVATCAEECANPGRDLPIGIMGSLAICAALYAAMCLVITGMSPASSIDTVSCISIKCIIVSYG
jgi:APA family basic amino acid/polyamine antiporter